MTNFSHSCLEFSIIYLLLLYNRNGNKRYGRSESVKITQKMRKKKIISIIEFSRQKDKKEENWVKKILKRKEKFPKNAQLVFFLSCYRKIRKNILFHPMRLSSALLVLFNIIQGIIVSQFGQFDLKLAHTYTAPLHLTIEMNPCAIKTLSFE